MFNYFLIKKLKKDKQLLIFGQKETNFSFKLIIIKE